MLKCLEERPDQTASELLAEFQVRYPGLYKATHLRTLRRRVGDWRRQAIQRLICEMKAMTRDVTVNAAEQFGSQSITTSAHGTPPGASRRESPLC